MTRKDSDLFKTRDRLAQLEQEYVQLKEVNRGLTQQLRDAEVDMGEERRQRQSELREFERIKLIGKGKIEGIEAEMDTLKAKGKAMIEEREQRIAYLEGVIEGVKSEGVDVQEGLRGEWDRERSQIMHNHSKEIERKEEVIRDL